MQILKKTNLKAYKKAIEIGPLGVIQHLNEKGLIGRAGGGFPTGKKWQIVRDADAYEKYLICNADEGEPGTFKDKFIIENNPELLVEGILIAAATIGVKKSYIYLRGEYSALKKKLEKTIKEVLKKAKSDLEIEVFLGAGAYVCGEETAIIASIEGKRGQARIRPPYPTIEGLFGKPTAINNVETLANVPLAVYDKKWNKDLRLYSISGGVKKPGVYELHLGMKLKDIISKAEPKNKVKAIYFGCSGGCLSYEQYKDIKLCKENVYEGGCSLGSCTLIVVDEKNSILDMATNIAKFYEYESCGRCTPCREGSMRVLQILERLSIGKGTEKDVKLLLDLGEVIKETAFCGLGQTSMNHLLTALHYFKEDFLERIKK